MRVISFAPNDNSCFVGCDSNAAAFAPHLKLSACVLDFYLHCSSRFRLAYPVASESERRQRLYSLPDVCNFPAGRSTQVFPPTESGVFPLLRCCRGQTEWACGTSGSEHRDTTACRPWAIEKYSTNLTSIRKNDAGSFPRVRRFGPSSLNSDLHRDNNVVPALVRTFARTRLVILMFSAITECEFGCGAIFQDMLARSFFTCSSARF